MADFTKKHVTQLDDARDLMENMNTMLEKVDYAKDRMAAGELLQKLSDTKLAVFKPLHSQWRKASRELMVAIGSWSALQGELENIIDDVNFIVNK